MRALASDFDGTLFFPEGFKEEDLNRIREFQKQGNLFGLCTGRDLKSILETVEGILDLDFYIVNSGACILDKNLKVIHQKCMDFEVMCEMVEHYRRHAEIYIQANQRLYAFPENSWLPDPEEIIQSAEEVEGEIYGISLFLEDEERAEKACRELNERYPDLTAFQNKGDVDVVRKGCSKGEGLLLVRELMQVDEMAGIGDSYNDISMLKAASPSFTFPSSPERVRSHAQILVDSVAEAVTALLGRE